MPKRWLFAAILSALSLYAAEPPVADLASTRAAFLKIIEHPRVPLAPELKQLSDKDGFLEYRFSFASDAAERVPGLLLKPSPAPAGRLPVVIALHGTGGNKEGQVPLLKELAARGFLTVAIDGRYHGERAQGATGSVEYNRAIRRAYTTGREHPFLYDTVWDVMRLVDYLETRPDVDARRIGLIGFSKGGMETYLAAAADPRIAVAVPCIGVQSFRWALENDGWRSRVETIQAAVHGAAGVNEINADFVRQFYDRVVPGIYSQFDGPAMLPLVAPRSLLVINGDSDARTPRPGLMQCVAAAEKAYREAGALDHFSFLLEENTAHRVTPAARQAAIDWFVRWLKP